MACPFVTAIEILGVPGEKFAHDAGYAVLAAPEEKMNVIGHQNPGVDGAVPLTHIETESLKEKVPVLIVFEYVGFVDAPHHDMMKGTGYIESGLAWHRSIIFKKGTLSRNISISNNVPKVSIGITKLLKHCFCFGLGRHLTLATQLPTGEPL